VRSASLANGLRAAVAGLSDSQLDTPYRPGGWTVRQVVHHLADAQMNWYIRTKLALTEDEPHVSPWNEVPWVELHDARDMPRFSLPIVIWKTPVFRLHTTAL
jgi:uncharacterized damage-inducible protein DinB